MSTIFPPRFLDELRTRLPLSGVVARSVKLVRAGREFKGCCPFHSEKSPSFYVNDDKQFYHCFGCGAHGDIIGFTMQSRNLSFPEAIEDLATQAGLDIPKADPKLIQQEEKRKDLYHLMETASLWFQSELHAPQNRKILHYVRERGIDEVTHDSFRIGYAPADGQALIKMLRTEGFSDADMIAAGIAKKSTKNNDLYAFFRDRLMFPVADRRGRIVAYGGRVLPESIAAPSSGDFTPPKYINSPDTILFHKGRLLYSESRARLALANNDDALIKTPIVVEGYMDVIACWKAGFKTAVAPLGTALTEDQITALWRLIPHTPKMPILCFDGDAAGQRAAQRAVARILPLLLPDQSVQIAFLPKGEDPDSLIQKHGQSYFAQQLQQSMSLIDYLWMIRSTAADLKTPEGRAGLEQTLENDTATIANAIVQKHYRSILRSKLWELSRESTRPVNKNTKSTKSIKTPLPPSAPLRPRAVFSESDMAYCLFSILIRFPTLLMTLEHDLMTQNITKPHDQHIRTLFLQALNQHQFTDSPAIQEFLKQSLSLDDIQTLLNNNNIPVRPDMNEDDALEFWHNLKKTRLQHHLLHDQKNLSKNIFDEDSFKQLQNMHKAKKSPDE